MLALSKKALQGSVTRPSVSTKAAVPWLQFAVSVQFSVMLRLSGRLTWDTGKSKSKENPSSLTQET
eukprot:6630218-Lingulodinium_polyedra.AAC.1